MSKLKRRIKKYVAELLYTSGIQRILETIPWPDNGLVVLVYHRLSSSPDLDDTLLSTKDSETFEEQMAFLVNQMYPIGGQDLIAHLVNGHPLPPRAVMVTFDDAYRDFLVVGWPIMKRYGVPATLFVPTAYPGGEIKSFWWDRLARALLNEPEGSFHTHLAGDFHWTDDNSRHKVLEKIRTLTENLPYDAGMDIIDEITEQLKPPPPRESVMCNWDDLRTLSSQGVILGAHTRSHSILTKVPLYQARNEILGSRDDLRHQIGISPTLFCYPNGLAGTFNKFTQQLLSEAGFVAAFVSLGGFNHPRTRNPLQLRRVGISKHTTKEIFQFKLATAAGGLPFQRQ